MKGASFNVHMELVDVLEKCEDLEALQIVCRQLADDLEFEHFIFGAYDPKSDSVSLVNGYPDEWRRHYDSSGYVHIDPTVAHCARNSYPVDWRGVNVDGRNELGNRVMDESKDFGICHGISIPVHGVGSEWGMFSFASARPLTAHQASATIYFQLVAQHVHETLKRVVSQGDVANRANRPIRLTQRERECLAWTARGKTAWEISRILQVSENTIVFHLKNAIRKLEVTNRTQAVAKAVSFALITQL